MTAVEVARWAFVVSIFSLTIALASFVWNVWSKFIYPLPKVRVRFGVHTLFPVMSDGSLGKEFRRLVLTVSNHGPGVVQVREVPVDHREAGRVKRGQVLPLVNSAAEENIWQAGGGDVLPRRLDAGDRYEFYFHADPSFLGRGVFRIGLTDSYGRHHWAPRGHVAKARRDLST